MVPIVSIVGKSNSGKTTLLEKLVPELIKRGYRVAAIKRSAHGFAMDHPGKDSFRLAEAGASTVAVASGDKVAVVKRLDHELSLREVANLVGKDEHIILTEGFKRSPTLKIEVSRREISGELICGEDELLALVTDQPFEIDVPQFGFEDVEGLADVIEHSVIRHAPESKIRS